MNDRETLVLRNLLTALKECGDFLLLESHLQTEVDLLTPRLSGSEFDTALARADADRLVTSVDGSRGRKFKINDNGRAWLIDNR